MKFKRYIAALGLITSLQLNLCYAFTPAPDLTVLYTGKVKEPPASNYILMDNEIKYKLAYIKAPSEFENQTKTYLTKLLNGKTITLYQENKALDRYNTAEIIVVDEKGTVAQSTLVSEGLSWAYITKENKALHTELKNIEKEARKNKKGFWGNELYVVKNINNVKDFINSYQLVEGIVKSVSTVKNSVYLNFGDNWKEDFTVRFPYLKNKDYSNWAGKKILARGWVESYYGPMINIENDAQIDIITEQK